MESRLTSCTNKWKNREALLRKCLSRLSLAGGLDRFIYLIEVGGAWWELSQRPFFRHSIAECRYQIAVCDHNARFTHTSIGVNGGIGGW